MLKDAMTTLQAAILQITAKRAVAHHTQPETFQNGARRAYVQHPLRHEDDNKLNYMRDRILADITNKAHKLAFIGAWLDSRGDVDTEQIPQVVRKTFTLRSGPFKRPCVLSKVLVCMNCSCCLTMEDIVATGWYLDNMEWILNQDINLCTIHYIRCPECYVKLQIDEGVRPMCEIPFGQHILDAPSTDVDELRATYGFEPRRFLRGQELYHASGAFFNIGGRRCSKPSFWKPFSSVGCAASYFLRTVPSSTSSASRCSIQSILGISWSHRPRASRIADSRMASVPVYRFAR
ncbi:hypothetical protein CYMTET_22218 [Cymbomonas tetramitiformis]|uniref:Uncharacterized protein n=1 Tax=Cymbomonas tetramitiformis TaxID=36881 RepID=A0AAE0G0U5_9CHLO|nr:hypothetical protein CYMTET_22218 [Cymbomonas tetramitiformis]